VNKTEINNTKQNHERGRIANVLIVDNDPEVVRFMLEISARKGIRANLAKDKKAATALLDKGDYELVFTSDKVSQGDARSGFELLRKIKSNTPQMPVIMIGKPQNQKEQNHQQIIEAAVKAIRAGCYDFLIKPLNREKIENIFDTFVPNHSVSTVASAEQDSRNLYTIVGRSPQLLQTISLAKRVAPTSAPVLISGESGTGKELVSYLIHHESRRAQEPYIKVNCAALSDSLLESELFGHEKGAFTGAYTQRRGRFEMAHGGTLLLDEITETPVKFQAKLLRVLEQQDFERVGGNENIKVDVRIISTTNKDLLQEVQNGRFREDLYYRLNVVRLFISPLRTRTEDLPDLVWHFVNLHANQAQRKITRLDPTMMEIFDKYHWSGNVRQLRNVILTSLILGIGQTLSLADVSWLSDGVAQKPCVKLGGIVGPKPMTEITDRKLNSNPGLGGMPLEQIERQAILDTLRQTDGNQTKAAKVLGISDRTLRDRLRRYREQGCPVSNA
jgi:DNA-binding NtrC family response regulator